MFKINKTPLDDFGREVKLMFNTIDNIQGLYAEVKTHPGGWVLTAIEAYFDKTEIKTDQKVRFFLLLLSDGAIGRFVKIFEELVIYLETTNNYVLTWERFNSFIKDER